MVLGHHCRHHFNWTLVIKALTRTSIQFVRDGVQLLLTIARQVRAFGQVLADQAIDVLIAAALPRAMRVTEVNSDAGTLCDFGVSHHFTPLVIRQRFTCGQRHPVQGGAKAFDRRSRCGVVHLHRHQVTRTALHQRADCGRIGLAFDEVALPMAGRQSGLPLPVGEHEC